MIAFFVLYQNIRSVCDSSLVAYMWHVKLRVVVVPVFSFVTIHGIAIEILFDSNTVRCITCRTVKME